MLERIVAHVCSGSIRALTGARALWRGCEPSADRRVYYGNHASHGDFVIIWSALPPSMRQRVRPVAAADYWNRGAFRRFLIHAVPRRPLLVELRVGGQFTLPDDTSGVCPPFPSRTRDEALARGAVGFGSGDGVGDGIGIEFATASNAAITGSANASRTPALGGSSFNSASGSASLLDDLPMIGG